ncbi:unnamed protein product (macronuclear) [Paramecium tetraurelia]|uniref:EF-hand domain-containing protein n=1 Tax=Paramecium tetraurelia TaxID=5888 RepID=A0BLB2_PARTE|nr:uncharacterized protein GSPATT00029961001 [Paramecium tetraurelia]CAK59329.1 unnamed protein product [Paramecium tetraurelia]|eukprot:XP_001426727.1 hypothetical protein (macronuclear) [Paramecium tetraurelia strain d4-2]
MQNKELSFEDSLRQSQLPQQQKQSKKKTSKQDKQDKQVKFTDEEIKIIEMLTPQVKQQQQAIKIANGKLDFLFDGSRDVNLVKPYHEDGDENMYSKENVTKRRKLKSDPEVVQSIEAFMAHYQFDINNKLIKENYLKTHIRLAYLLRKDIEEDREEIKFLLLEDWEHDSKGNGFMTRAELYDSLFELVDTWTPDAEKSEYIGFFELLEQKYKRQQDEKFEQLYYEIMES